MRRSGNSNAINKYEFHSDFVKSIKDDISEIDELHARYTRDRKLLISRINESIRLKLPSLNKVANSISTKMNTRFLSKEDRDIYNKELNTIATIISIYPVSFKSPVEWEETVIHKLKIRTIVNDIKALDIKLLELNFAKKDIKPQYINYETYAKVIDIYNRNAVKLILNGGEFELGEGLGKLRILRVTRKRHTNKKIDFHKSNKYKQTLIKEGKIPYNKKDAEECKAKGIPYEGVDWHIYIYKDYYLYIDWMFHDKLYSNYYSFYPTRTNYKDDREELIKKIQQGANICEEPMGIVKYIYLLDEALPDYHTNFTSYSKN